MTHPYVLTRQPGFNTGRKKPNSFAPTESQIEIAAKRMLASLHRLGGRINVRCEGDAIDFFCQKVFNRDRQLGDIKRGHFRKVIIAAFEKLMADGKLVIKHDVGVLETHEKPPTQRRQHHQKYPRGYTNSQRTA